MSDHHNTARSRSLSLHLHTFDILGKPLAYLGEALAEKRKFRSNINLGRERTSVRQYIYPLQLASRPVSANGLEGNLFRRSNILLEPGPTKVGSRGN